MQKEISANSVASEPLHRLTGAAILLALWCAITVFSVYSWNSHQARLRIIENSLGGLHDSIDDILRRSNNARLKNVDHFSEIVEAAFEAAKSDPLADVNFDKSQIRYVDRIFNNAKEYGGFIKPEFLKLGEEAASWNRLLAKEEFKGNLLNAFHTFPDIPNEARLTYAVKNAADIIYAADRSDELLAWILEGPAILIPVNWSDVRESGDIGAVLRAMRDSNNSSVRNVFKYGGLADITPIFIDGLKKQVQVQIELLQKDPTQSIQFQSIPLTLTSILKFSPVVIVLLFSAFYVSYKHGQKRAEKLENFPNFGLNGDLSTYFNLKDFDETLKAILWTLFLVLPLLLLVSALVYENNLLDLRFVWLEENTDLISFRGQYRIFWRDDIALGMLNVILYIFALAIIFRISDDGKRYHFLSCVFSYSAIVFVILSAITIGYTYWLMIEYSKASFLSASGYLQGSFIVPMFVISNMIAGYVALRRKSVFLSSIIVVAQCAPSFLV